MHEVFFTYFFFPSFILTGIGFFVYRRMMVWRTASWRCTKGEITRSEVVRETTGKTGNRMRVAVPKIEYTYRIGSKIYTGKTICMGGTLNTTFGGGAEERCRQYPAGATVNVYHDPDNGAVSVLERSTEGDWFILAMVAGVTFFYLLFLAGIIF